MVCRPLVYKLGVHGVFGDAGGMIEVRVVGRGVERRLKWVKGMRVRDVIRAMDFNTESAIAKVNGKVALEDDNVEDGSMVEVIPVVSGG